VKKPSARPKSDGTGKANQPDNSSPDLHLLERQARTAIQQMVRVILSDQSSDITRGSAAWALHRLTYEAVNALGEIARRKPSLFRPIAETSVAWPAFISWHGDYTKENLELMKCLGLGEKHFFRFKFLKGKRGKRWSLRTPANRFAIRIIQKLFARQCTCRAFERDRLDKELMEIYKRHGFEVPRITFQSAKLTKQILALEPLSVDTIDEWFDAGWNLLLEETQGHPERHPDLRQLGTYRKAKTIAANLTPNLGGKASESNIRDGIKERLKRAFVEVVAPSNAKSK
jgi:hypothetical protein